MSSFEFYAKLKAPQSSNILESIKKFIDVQFETICKESDDLNDISSQFQDFISQLTFEYAKVWNVEFYTNKKLYPNIINGFENILCKILYKEILEQFEDIRVNFECLQFITLEHLNICDYQYQKNFDELSSQMRKFCQISQYKTPKEKIIIICNLCNFINSTYANLDRIKLTKFLVFMFIHSEIKNLKTQLLYCALFRHKTIIGSDEDYYLSLSLQAIEYCSKINYKSLKMTQEEFEAKKKEKISNEFNVNSTKDFQMDKIDSILNIPITQLYEQYYNKDKNEMTIGTYEKLRSDFKIILKLIESNKI